MLPGMLALGDSAIMVVGGLTAMVPMSGLSGVGPAMAAARNYIFSLNAEAMPKRVYGGTVNIGGVIDRSTGLPIES